MYIVSSNPHVHIYILKIAKINTNKQSFTTLIVTKSKYCLIFVQISALHLEIQIEPAFCNALQTCLLSPLIVDNFLDLLKVFAVA